MSDPFAWLDRWPVDADGFLAMSAPRFYQMDEADYDARYRIDPADERAGRELAAFLQDQGWIMDLPLLELGCGTGRLSVGLAAAGVWPRLILSDPSPAFLRLTRDKLQAAGHAPDLAEGPARLAVLSGEDLALLPAGSLGGVVLRSALHHIPDVPAFLAMAGRTLAPGGVLVCQEPCAEGYLLMAVLAQSMPCALRQAGHRFEEAELDALREFVATVTLSARRDVDKGHLEDKHLFRPEETAAWAEAAGLRQRFLANLSFEDLALADAPAANPFSFTRFFLEYLEHCMAFPPRLLGAVRELFPPWLEVVEAVSVGGHAPACHGVFLWRKEGA